MCTDQQNEESSMKQCEEEQIVRYKRKESYLVTI